MQFSFIFSATGKLDGKYYPCDTSLQDCINVLTRLEIPFDLTEPGDSEYNYLAEEDHEPENSYWHNCQDIQASGIIDAEKMKTLCQDLGAYPSHCATMGSLGGPLGLGCVWDIDFRIESAFLISCLRMTPIPEWRKSGEWIDVKPERVEHAINRLEKAVTNYFDKL